MFLHSLMVKHANEMCTNKFITQFVIDYLCMAIANHNLNGVEWSHSIKSSHYL